MLVRSVYTVFIETVSSRCQLHTEILSGFLKQILARRETCGIKSTGKGSSLTLHCEHGTPFKEVKEIVVLPELDRSVAVKQVDANSIVLPIEVTRELHLYIRRVAESYNSNPCTYTKHTTLLQRLISLFFICAIVHNFEHARYVVGATIIQRESLPAYAPTAMSLCLS